MSNWGFTRLAMSRKMKRQVFLAVFSICALITVLVSYLQCRHTHHYEALGKKRLTSSEKKEVVEYDRSMPLIFIGGVPRSGTTLMRAMLDAHSHVRCGEETRLVPRLLSLKSNWFKSELESKRLREAGITHDVVNDAVASFILEIIVKHGEPAPRLCNKDPFTLRYSLYLNQLFPNGKYLLMIRDGRAVVHSIISRKITITGFNLNSYKQCLEKWNGAIEIMYHQCLQLGSRTCLLVYYEQLVLQPERWLQKIVRFLDLPWDDAMLHHQDFVGKKGGISLSKRERSSDQVIKPVYHEALTKWVGNIPPDVADHMDTIAPMLRTLGYDPHANPPNYGVPDNVVSQKHPDQNDEQRRREDEGENNHNFLPYTE